MDIVEKLFKGIPLDKGERPNTAETVRDISYVVSPAMYEDLVESFKEDGLSIIPLEASKPYTIRPTCFCEFCKVMRGIR